MVYITTGFCQYWALLPITMSCEVQFKAFIIKTTLRLLSYGSAVSLDVSQDCKQHSVGKLVKVAKLIYCQCKRHG